MIEFNESQRRSFVAANEYANDLMMCYAAISVHRSGIAAGEIFYNCLPGTAA
jgi:hypothetical protein